MTYNFEPFICPICGKPRGYRQPDHADCARQKQQENAERNMKLDPARRRVRDQSRAAYLAGVKKQWWPD